MFQHKLRHSGLTLLRPYTRKRDSIALRTAVDEGTNLRALINCVNAQGSPRGPSRWAKSCPIDSFETSGGSGDADRSAGGTTALDRFEPFASPSRNVRFPEQRRPSPRSAMTASRRFPSSPELTSTGVVETALLEWLIVSSDLFVKSRHRLIIPRSRQNPKIVG